MIITSDYIYHNPSIDSVSNIKNTIIEEHGEKYGNYDFYNFTMKNNIEFIDLINIKTKNINLIGLNLMYIAH